MNNVCSSRSASNNHAPLMKFVGRLRKSRAGLIPRLRFLIDTVPHLNEGQCSTTAPLFYVKNYNTFSLLIFPNFVVLYYVYMVRSGKMLAQGRHFSLAAIYNSLNGLNKDNKCPKGRQIRGNTGLIQGNFCQGSYFCLTQEIQGLHQ